MKTEEKKTVNETVKAEFETPVIEIVGFAVEDVITTSSGFSGDDDPILPPDFF